MPLARLFPTALLFHLLFVAAGYSRAPIRQLREVQELSRSELDRHPAVEIKGILTLYEPSRYVIILQQGNRAMYVACNGELIRKNPPSLRAGDEVVLAGTAANGGFAPIVEPGSIVPTGKHGLPAPVDIRAKDLNDDRFDNVLGRVRGRVRRVEAERFEDGGSRLNLDITADGVHFLAVVFEGDAGQSERWIGSDMEFTGVMGSLHNARHQRRATTIFLHPSGLRLLSPAVLDWEKTPVRQIGTLLTWRSGTRLGDTVRVTGQITYAAGGLVWVQDDTSGIPIMPAHASAPTLGQFVEVLGRLSQNEKDDFVLAEALVRPAAGTLRPIEPLKTVPYDTIGGRLVKIRAPIREIFRGERREVLLLQGVENQGHTAELVRTGGDPATAGLEPGDVVELTGVADYEYGALEPSILRLHLRSASDIQVVSRRPWQDQFPWGRVTLFLGVVAAAALGWIQMLRREVRKQTAELERVNDAKSQFLANMSHEIRTPMNGVLGMSRILLDTPLSDQQRDYAETVHASAESLLRLLNDILDLSKMESGRLHIEQVNMDIGYLLRHAVNLVRPVAAEKRVEVILELPKVYPHAVLGDPTRVRQVVMNFLSNAVKFTAKGKITVRLEWAGPISDGAEGRARVEVQDTGLGMTPDQLSRIFTRFEQGDVSIARRYGGTGLGLSISKHLAELMGGTVGCSSIPGQGSTFWYELPMSAARQAAAEETPHDDLGSAGVSGARILLAEDNRTNQKVACALLGKMGCEVVAVANGAEAVERVRAGESFDVILMDCHMPEMDGYEATRQLRSTGCRTPIIALTAGAMESDRRVCLDAGMDAYLAKPFRISDLQNHLAAWIGRQSDRVVVPENLVPAADKYQ